MSDMEIHTAEFTRALQQVIRYSSRDAADETNKAALNVVIKAQKATPKADPEKIVKSLWKSVPGRQIFKNPKKPSPLVYKLIAAKTGRPGLSRTAMATAAKKFVNRKKSGSGFTSIGYQQAALAFGGRGFGRVRPSYWKTDARAGYGIKAVQSTNEVIARLANTAPWILHIGIPALNEAFAAAAPELMRRLGTIMANRFREAH